MKFRIDLTVEVSIPCASEAVEVLRHDIERAVTEDVLRRFHGRETKMRVSAKAIEEGNSGPRDRLSTEKITRPGGDHTTAA